MYTTHAPHIHCSANRDNENSHTTAIVVAMLPKISRLDNVLILRQNSERKNAFLGGATCSRDDNKTTATAVV